MIRSIEVFFREQSRKIEIALLIFALVGAPLLGLVLYNGSSAAVERASRTTDKICGMRC